MRWKIEGGEEKRSVDKRKRTKREEVLQIRCKVQRAAECESWGRCIPWNLPEL